MHLNACAAIEGYVVHVHDRVLLDDDAVLVHIGYTDAAKVRDCAVVGEYSTTPLAADEADAAEPEAIVNATVEPNVRSPIAAMPAIHSAFITPVTGGP